MMIKVGDKRFNLDEIWTYEPALTIDTPCIRIETRQGVEADILFINEEQRDKVLESMDGLMVVMIDGDIIQDDPTSIPHFVIPDGGFDPSGGINLQ